MTPEQAKSLLDRLLRRAYPTEFQRAEIARLQRLLGLPVEHGPGYARHLVRVAQRRSLEREIREIRENRAVPPRELPPIRPRGGPYIYRRIVELGEPDARRNHRFYHVIRVDSPVSLTGRALEEAFRIEILFFRRDIHYGGELWYVTPEQAYRSIDHYAPENPLYTYEEDLFPDYDYDYESEAFNS